MKILNWLRREIQIGNSKIQPEQGVITIMAIMIIVPSILFAVLMIETTRHIATKNEADVAMQAVGNDVLKNYDQYTYERFGVMSYDQSQNMQKLTDKDIAASQGIFSGDIEDVLAEGVNPLSDIGALEANITGYSEYNGLGAAFNKFVKLDKLLSMFNDMLKLTNLDILAAGAKEAGEEVKKLEKEGETAANLADSVQSKIDQYNGLYDSWASAVETAAAALQAARDKADSSLAEEGHDDSKIDSTYDSEVKAAKAGLEKPYNNYYNWHTEMDSLFANYRDGMLALNNAIDAFNNASRNMMLGTEISAAKEKAQNAQRAADDINEKLKDASLTEQERTDLTSALGECQDELDEANADKDSLIKEESEQAAGTPNACIADFDSISDEISKEKTQLAHYDKETMNQPDPAIYHCLDFSKFLGRDKIKEILEQYRQDLSGAPQGMLDALKNLFSKFGLPTLFADPHLNAQINTNYYEDIDGLLGNKGILDGEINMDPLPNMVGDLIKVITTPMQLLADLATLDIFKLLLDIVDFFLAIGDFVMNIGVFVKNIVQRLVDIGTGRTDKFLVLPYLAFNFSNRLSGRETLGNGVFNDYKHTGDNLSGISFANMRYTPPDNSVETFFNPGGISDILKGALGSIPSGSDYAFSSCELEYIFTGKTSELTAQEFTFVSIMLFRLLPNITAVGADKILKPMLEIPIAGEVTFLLALIGESFVDAFLIVNGAPIKTIGKDKCFIAEDLYNFEDKLFKLEGGNKIIGDSIRDNFKEACPRDPNAGVVDTSKSGGKDTGKSGDGGKEGDDGKKKSVRSSLAKEYLESPWAELDYTQHIFIMMFAGDNREYVKRVHDLIEMEGTLNTAYEYYGKLGDRNDIEAKVETLRHLPGQHYYDINKAYTRVKVSSRSGIKKKLFGFGSSTGGLNKMIRNEINMGY
ncbi:MAG: hypothetical protein LBN08_06585 [Lactobacillales bacterium]|jgi:hypothetical protein|nr:hypothetical protein [Lactobacillales bacterium]